MSLDYNILKPWPNACARQVENLGPLATLFGQALGALALTWNELCSLRLSSNLQASQSKFLTVWPPNPSQRKLSDVH